jgi:hypothetical protein
VVDNVVLHSAGAFSKLLQIACLYASGVRAPEYVTPLMVRVGDPDAPFLFEAASSAFKSEIHSGPDALAEIFAKSIPAALLAFIQQAFWVSVLPDAG